MPVDWAKTKPVLDKLAKAGKDKSAKAPLSPLSEQFIGPAAVCWYGSSRLYTPVFVATKKVNADISGMAEHLFDAAIGKAEAGNAVPIVASNKNGDASWQRKVLTRYGKYGQGDQANLLPTLASHQQTVVFSPDDKLVEQVLAVLRKQAPAVADKLPDAKHTVGLISPAALAMLIQKEAFASLPQAEEQVLRGAANAHLVPRLNALKKYPPYRLVLAGVPPASGFSWMPVEWQAVGP
jgi:uncharacterized protein YfaA (DUF2138 family)